MQAGERARAHARARAPRRLRASRNECASTPTHDATGRAPRGGGSPVHTISISAALACSLLLSRFPAKAPSIASARPSPEVRPAGGGWVVLGAFVCMMSGANACWSPPFPRGEVGGSCPRSNDLEDVLFVVWSRRHFCTLHAGRGAGPARAHERALPRLPLAPGRQQAPVCGLRGHPNARAVRGARPRGAPGAFSLATVRDA